MPKHFCKVFQRMHGGVRADELALPVLAGPGRVMVLQSFVIGGGFISKKGTEFLAAVAGEGELFAVAMADLVPKVPKHLAIRLVHALPERLAMGVVAFRQVKGDDAVLVASDDLPLTTG